MGHKVHKGGGIQNIGIHGDYSGALVGKDAALIEYGHGGVGHGLKAGGLLYHYSLLGTVAHADDGCQRNGHGNGHGRGNEYDGESPVDGNDIGIVCKYWQSDSIDHGQNHCQLQNRAGTAFHHRFHGHGGGFPVVYQFGHLAFYPVILIVKQLQRSLFGVVHRIIDEHEPDLIEEDQRSALNGKAYKIGQEGNKHHHYGDGEIIPFLYGCHRLQDYVISGSGSGNDQEDYAEKVRHADNKRDGENNRCYDQTNDHQGIVVW